MSKIYNDIEQPNDKEKKMLENLLSMGTVIAGEFGVKFRDNEINRVYNIMDKAEYRSVMLVGDHGCGKRSIIDGYVEKLEDNLRSDMVIEIDFLRFLANAQASDFNKVLAICSVLVFLFLWIAFRRLELALAAFLPMVVSWIWITGIMGIFGVSFNIVNIILATFIFGLGDDYTIFMVEGLQYEHTFRKPLLSSYKTGVTLSALTMFVGIGSLVFAVHPALHSRPFSIIPALSFYPPFPGRLAAPGRL